MSDLREFRALVLVYRECAGGKLQAIQQATAELA